jgi:dihydropteroate synthase
MLRLGTRRWGPGETVVMAIVNRTTDSFYDRGATWEEGAALERVDRVVDEGAGIVDIGGIKAAPGAEIDADEEIRRVVGFVGKVRAAYPELVISVDTWRSEVAREACLAGADLLNDAWGGHDPRLKDVAAEFGAGLVCTHVGGVPPRTRPFRIEYDDVMADVVAHTTALAAAAVAAGVERERVLVDPAHDFGKNTRQSLEVTRRLDDLVATGWPVLVSVSNKDFVGETLDRPVAERTTGTLAATAVCAWHGAQVYRAHDVARTRETLDVVGAVKGDVVPARLVRGLA